MFTYNEIVSIISSKSAGLLKRMINKGVIKEEQIGIILQKSMHLKKSDGDYAVKIAVNKLLYALSIIEALDLVKYDKKALNETLNRLSLRNGHETFNELVAHHILGRFFKSYTISPLYKEGRDGEVINEGQIVAVEIKSRFPEKYQILMELCENHYNELCKIPRNIKVVHQLDIKSIKGISHDVVKLDTQNLGKSIKKINFDQLSLPISGNYSSEENNLKYEATFHFERAITSARGFGVSAEDWQKIESELFYFYLGAEVHSEMNIMSGLREVQVRVSDEVKEDLANSLITACIKNAKNIPSEPRIIAIYSDYGKESLVFVRNTIDKYVKNHSKTIIMLIRASFTADGAFENYVTYMSVGKDMLQFMQQQFIAPAS